MMNNDLISRETLKEAIETYDKFACLPNGKLEPFRNLEHPEMFEPYVHLRDILKAIDNAPTVCNNNYAMGYQDGVKKVLSERPQGEWIGEHFVYKCSKCGHIADSVITVTGRDIIPMLSNFCPECGADMRGDK